MKSPSIEELEACLATHVNSTLNINRNQSIVQTNNCPTAWDGFNCWESTEPGQISYRPCPTVKGSVGSDSTYMAFRKCGQIGKWLNRESLPSEVGWTNYTPCFTPEIREVIRRLGSQDEAQTKLNIAVNTRLLELVGLSLSLTALVVSLIIFFKFRTLRNTRTRLHRHLFIAVLIQTSIRLTLYIDQAITRTRINHGSIRSATSLSQESLRGIDNTAILCEAGYVLLEYARTCMFFWMFIEGLYLHNRITVTVFEEKLSPYIYCIVGWIMPIPLTFVWAVVTWINYGSATCWWGYNFTLSYWILEAPRLGILLVNLAFLLNILRILVMKLRRSSETDQVRKAVKAALLLLPLLGLTNLLNMLSPLDKAAWIFGIWSYSTHLLTSCQGLILASLYCFCNGEVQVTLRKYLRSRILGRNKVRLPRSSIRMSLLNHTVVAQMDPEQKVKPSPTSSERCISPQPTAERDQIQPVRIPQPDKFVHVKFIHSKSCNNNMEIQYTKSEERVSVNSKKSSISACSSIISQLKRDNSTIDTFGVVGKLHGLRLLCKSSRRKSVESISNVNDDEHKMNSIHPNSERDVIMESKDEHRQSTEVEDLIISLDCESQKSFRN